MSHRFTYSISLKDARFTLLRAQFNLHSKSRAKSRVFIANEWIRHLGWVQIDTIHVIERAHHHILFSRVPGFQPNDLIELQAKHRTVFEYWTHALCYLPIESFRYALPMMTAYRTGRRKGWRPVSKREVEVVRMRLQSEGALDLSAFEANPNAVKRHAWASKKPSKAALEWLFFAGEVMISRREGMRKFYDLTERMLPSHVDVTDPSDREIGRFWIEAALRSQVFLTEKEIAYQKADYRKQIAQALREGCEEGEYETVRIEGSRETYFAKRGAFEKQLGRASAESSETFALRLLNPFDPLVIQRRRLQTLFAFSYTIECYVPEKKRKFGYYSLPILYRGEFVGVIDLKADRPEKTLRVQALHLFHPERLGRRTEFQRNLAQALQDMLDFQGCERVSGLSDRGVLV